MTLLFLLFVISPIANADFQPLQTIVKWKGLKPADLPKTLAVMRDSMGWDLVKVNGTEADGEYLSVVYDFTGVGVDKRSQIVNKLGIQQFPLLLQQNMKSEGVSLDLPTLECTAGSCQQQLNDDKELGYWCLPDHAHSKPKDANKAKESWTCQLKTGDETDQNGGDETDKSGGEEKDTKNAGKQNKDEVKKGDNGGGGGGAGAAIAVVVVLLLLIGTGVGLWWFGYLDKFVDPMKEKCTCCGEKEVVTHL